MSLLQTIFFTTCHLKSTDCRYLRSVLFITGRRLSPEDTHCQSIIWGWVSALSPKRYVEQCFVSLSGNEPRNSTGQSLRRLICRFKLRSLGTVNWRRSYLEKKYEVQTICVCRLGYRLLQNIGCCRLVRLHGFWSIHLFFGRHAFLLLVGMYSYTNLGMDISFILNL